MLSIGKISLGKHSYYERQVAQGADDYYSGRGEAPGEWTGAGAKALGLSGRVSAAQFNALMRGHDPRTPDTRLRSSAHDPKIAALDLTFSAPKSLSVLFAVASEPVSGALVACHEEAVRASLAYLEDAAVCVRRGRGGERVECAQGLIAAAYRHRMSRALDPQLHTHVVAANMARGPDGRFTALHATPLYEAAKTAGYLYQSHLRALISERLGLTWTHVHKGAAELEGVEQLVIKEFSKRRHEMLRAAEDGGIVLSSKAAAQSAALATRERKQYGVQTHTWREEVRARAGELGLGCREIEQLLRAGQERIASGRAKASRVDERALGDHLAGPQGLTEKANAFDRRPVLQAFALAAQRGMRVADLRARAERFLQRADVRPLARSGEFTTEELVACERRLIVAAVGRAGEQTAILDGAFIGRALALVDRPLTSEQEQAVRAVAQSGEGVSVIEALAGTGKTYTAGVLGALYERAGYQVLGTAPTARAVRELASEAGVPSRTLDRLLLDLERRGERLPERCVLILDEAGMAATRPSMRLLRAARRAQAKVIAIGDPGQLSSVQAGGWLAAVSRRLGPHRLTQVMRQRDPQERRALGALHDSDPERYLAWAKRAGRVETLADPAAACNRACREWEHSSASLDPSRAVMIARDNETRTKLNELARTVQHGRGALDAERSYGPLPLAVGDRIICRRNDRTADVDNGTRATVRALDADRVVIETDTGHTRTLSAGYVARHVEYAYALTAHCMQGATVESAIVLAAPHDLTAGWSYTALSRARGQTRLLVHASELDSERSEFAPGPPSPPCRDELLARVARRMTDRDDEDLAADQLRAPFAHVRDSRTESVVQPDYRLNVVGVAIDL